MTGSEDDDEQESASRPASDLDRLPPHWRELWLEVLTAWAAHAANPEAPFYKIGRFDALGLRGVGGLGAVFEVVDPELDRHVALKLCLTRGPKAAKAIIREAKAMARLSHPNIVTVHETGKFGDDVFFVMELVTGANNKPLTGRRLIRKQPHWRDVVEIYRAVARGLAAAHEAGVVHGDFKPGNVLIDAKGRPRVADFGFAQVMLKHVADGEQAGLKHQIGTLPYMAPEVLRGLAGGPLADQWSFCVSLWETVAGVRPYFGTTAAELLEAFDEDEPYAPAYGCEFPKRLREILRKGLALEPGERYPDMDTLADELDEFLKAELDEQPAPEEQPAPAEAPPKQDTTPEQEPPPKKRPRGGILVFMTVGAICVLVGALGTALILGSQRLEQARAPEPPADTATGSGSGGSTGDTSEDAEEIAETLAEVLELIEAGDFAKADKRWANQVDKLKRTDLLRASALEISRAFLERAGDMKRRGQLEQAKVAGEFARWWAVAAQNTPGEADSPAARQRDDAMDFLRELRRADSP